MIKLLHSAAKPARKVKVGDLIRDNNRISYYLFRAFLSFKAPMNRSVFSRPIPWSWRCGLLNCNWKNPFWRFAAPLTMVLLSAFPARATPTTAPLFGPTGLGTVPTTQTVPAGSLEIGGAFESVDPDVGRVRFFPELTATYGFNRGEIGVGTLREEFEASGFESDRRYLSIHAKYRFFESDRSRAALSLGAQHLGFSRGGDVNTLSLAASLPVRAAPQRLDGSDAVPTPDGLQTARLHLGLFHHRVQGSGNETRPFVGFEAPLSLGRASRNSNFLLVADYAPRAGSIDSLASLALRFHSPGGLGAQIGLGAIGGDRKLFTGLTYRFGFGS